MFIRQATKWLFPSVMFKGYSKTINSQAVTVLQEDASERALLVRFDTAAITDGGAGYAGGCRHYKDNGNGTTSIYENQGDYTSCDFNLVETVSAVITAVVAGAGLLGGATEGSATLNVGMTVYNNTGLTLAANALVYVNGYTSTNGMTVALADADAGLVATHFVPTAINNAAAGNIYPVGRGTGANTNGRTIGDLVYLDSTAGGFTFTAPTGDDQVVQVVGVVKVVHASTGEIEFFPGNRVITKIPPSMLNGAARTRTAILPFRLVAPSGSNQGPFDKCTFQMSKAFTVVSVKIASDTATTGSDATNNYNFMPKNVTAAANLHTSATTTQGAELSATAPKSITVSQNLSFTANQVFEIVMNIADDGSAGPTDLSGAEMYAILEYTI